MTFHLGRNQCEVSDIFNPYYRHKSKAFSLRATSSVLVSKKMIKGKFKKGVDRNKRGDGEKERKRRKE